MTQMAYPIMVERIARAIRKYGYGTERGWIYEIHEAEAALEALRTPTHEMMIAGDKALETETDNPPSWEALQAMINAALASPPKE